MLQATAIPFAAAISLAFVTSATAQVTKPRPSSSTDRLPKPETVTAAQEAGGPIRVVWSAVEGATGYTLTRSVPPSPSAPVTLPNAADTQYVDRDIRAGNTYYYLVSAVNEAGIPGLKMSAPPVKAVGLTANRPPDPPAGIRAVLNGSTADISWSSMRAGDDGYLVERAKITDNRLSSWVTVANRIPCCRASDRLDGYPAGTRIRYQVSAVNPTFLTERPGLSNEITIAPGPWTDTTGGQGLPADTTTGRPPTDTTTGQAPPTDTTTATSTNVRPAVVPVSASIKVGGSLNLGKNSTFTSLRLQKPRWLSLDETKATVDSRGKVLGRAAGFTYIVAIGLTPDGSVASMVQRVDVARR